MDGYLENIDVLARAHSSQQPYEIKGLWQQSDLIQWWKELGSYWRVGDPQASIYPLTDKSSMSTHQSETEKIALGEGLVCPNQQA